jgi:hypothetical protein
MWERINMLRLLTRLGLFAVSAWFLMLSGTGYATGDNVLQDELRQTMQKVREGQTTATRTEAAENLSGITRRMDPRDVDEKMITDLTHLLDSPDDSVRYWVARSLGNLGTRAKASIPALEKLLPKADCLQGSKTSASGIRLALTQIGVTPPPPQCGADRK